MRAWNLAALGGALILAGCASGLPKESLAGRETAQVTFAKGYIGQVYLGKSANTIYDFYADKDCKTGGRVPLTAITGNERVETIIAGKMFFTGNANFYYAGGQTKTCTIHAGFTARAGGRYSVVVRTSERGCVFEIKDLGTDRPPAGLAYFKSLSACPVFMRAKPVPPPPILVPRPPTPPLAEPTKT